MIPPKKDKDKERTQHRILMVDDNRTGLAARKTILEEHGYLVAAAHSPAEALDRYRQETFDLVVTDYRMPDINGKELIARLRARTPEVPVILMSSVAETLGLKPQDTGADVIIQKSNLEHAHLVRAVSRLLKKARRKTQTPRKPSNRAKAAPTQRAAAGSS